jgi:hypothetical protein
MEHIPAGIFPDIDDADSHGGLLDRLSLDRTGAISGLELVRMKLVRLDAICAHVHCSVSNEWRMYQPVGQ